MKNFSILVLVSLFCRLSEAQGGTPDIVNKLPDYITPTPEASGIFKAQQIAVNYASGSPNINIPIGAIAIRDYSLPINLAYNSTGVRVDDYAAMTGMGWNLSYGGVVSRTIFDKPDEMRSSSNSSFTINFATQNQVLLDFVSNAPDKENDIFTISIPGYSGKFILDSNMNPVFLSNSNYSMQAVSGSFTNGFVLTTDDGTKYYFQDAETSLNRNPSGTNCEKTYDAFITITSWYLTRIVTPSTRKQINFSYASDTITFESTISQTISKVITAGNYACSGGRSGNACTIGSERFSTCIPTQVVTNKRITNIQSSDGDKVDFIYDGTARTDLQGGKRLSEATITNRNGWIIKDVFFYGSYQSVVGGGSGYRIKRLFLDSLVIKSITATGISPKKMIYRFGYNDYAALPARLSYGQDFYGYYNGKNSNPSLLPVLVSGDINYTTYSNGTGATSVNFGDRSIDTAYAIKGLLNKLTYPTGGYDTIMYCPNRYLNGSTEQLEGGNSVYKILSYTSTGAKAHEHMFIYRFKSSNALSALPLNINPRFSQVNTVTQDGLTCNGVFMCEGLQCQYAVVTSNTTVPLMALGSQHLYHQSVLEYENGTGGTNGMTEHQFTIFGSGTMYPEHIMGNYNLNAPYDVESDVVIGEPQTNVYSLPAGSSTYQLLKAKHNYLRLNGFSSYYSYNVKRNFTYTCHSTPPVTAEFDPFDVDRVYIDKYTVLADSSIETDYTDPSNPLVSKQIFQYANSAYSYPTKITSYHSDGSQNIIQRKYPQDYTGYNFMTTRNIVSPVIEERSYKNTTLLTTLTNTYIDWFSDTKNIVLQSRELKRDSTTQMGKINFSSYDTTDNVQELAKVNDEKIAYIWDYALDYPVAKITNALQANTAYTSFEANGKGNWTYSGLTSIDFSSPTGYRCYYLPNGFIFRSGLTSTKNYILSYWTKNGSAYSIAGTISGYPKQGKTIGSWTYFEHKLTGQTYISLSGTGYLDELRLYPDTSLMTTYTYEPLVGITSQCDANNRITYFEYDEMARLKLIRDQDKNIVKYFCYNYAGEPFDCNHISSIYYNHPLSQIFTRNNCGGIAYLSGSVTYTVAGYTYSSTISQADADNQALSNINTNGQSYANTNGTCTTCTSCSGVDKKCIHAVCETGVKVYTASVFVSTHLYNCTYHYEWSDGSWSQDYVEQSPVPCQLGGGGM